MIMCISYSQVHCWSTNTSGSRLFGRNFIGMLHKGRFRARNFKRKGSFSANAIGWGESFNWKI